MMQFDGIKREKDRESVQKSGKIGLLGAVETIKGHAAGYRIK